MPPALHYHSDFGGPIYFKINNLFLGCGPPVRDASGIFFCRFLKIISQMFDGFKEKCYLCRRNEEINDSYSQAGHGLRVATVI